MDRAFYEQSPTRNGQFHPVTNKWEICLPKKAHERFLSEVPTGCSDEDKWNFVVAAHSLINAAWLLLILGDKVRCRQFVNYVKLIDATTALLQAQKWRCFRMRHDPQYFEEHELALETPATAAPGVQSVTPEENIEGTELFPDKTYALQVASKYLQDKRKVIEVSTRDPELKLTNLLEYLYENNAALENFVDSFEGVDGSFKSNSFASRASNGSLRGDKKLGNGIPQRISKNVLYLTLFILEISSEKSVPARFVFVQRGVDRRRCKQFLNWMDDKGWKV